MNFDPRFMPARPDLAAAHLRGRVEATRFVECVAQEVIAGHAPLRQEPSHGALLFTEALHGELVMVYESDDEGWAWGQLMADGYVGWLPAAALLARSAEPTHKVSALRTLVFPGPSIKLPTTNALPFGAQVAVVREDESFAVTAAGGYVPRRHLAEIGTAERDHVAMAERFLGAPYLWGGKTSLGVDCSGLVQIALTACGIPCPRDSDIQEQAIGRPAGPHLQRGDLLFWEGHVAIARDPDTLIHANAFHMQVAIEPVAEAVARIRSGGSEVTSVRRVGPGG
jgi:cell wall-associated NlpC family hydrolase